MLNRYLFTLGVLCCTLAVHAGGSNQLRFQQANYNVPVGQSSVTATIVYDLSAGAVVGDNQFDLSAAVRPSPGTGTIAVSGAARSTPYLYDSALGASGVFNTPVYEFSLSPTGVLMVNQGANAPVSDMTKAAGTYKYVDVTFAITGPIGSVFDLSFANALLDDQTITAHPLVTLPSTITIVPEPASLILLGLGGLLVSRNRKR